MLKHVKGILDVGPMPRSLVVYQVALQNILSHFEYNMLQMRSQLSLHCDYL